MILQSDSEEVCATTTLTLVRTSHSSTMSCHYKLVSKHSSGTEHPQYVQELCEVHRCAQGGNEEIL